MTGNGEPRHHAERPPSYGSAAARCASSSPARTQRGLSDGSDAALTGRHPIERISPSCGQVAVAVRFRPATGMASRSLCFMRRSRCVASPLSLSVRVAWLLASATSCRGHTPVSDPQLGAGIREALVAGSDVNVLVALATRATDHDAGNVSAAIARAQDTVLSMLDSADFRLRQRYAGVPAFSGTLRSARGLDHLLAHSLVRRVDREVGGTGSTPHAARLRGDTSQPSRKNPAQ